MKLPRNWRTVLATVVVALAGTAALASVTRDFSTVTSEGARRIDLARSPRALPPIPMIDSEGKPFSLAAIGQAGAPVFITLVYTQCVTVCRTGASGQSYLQAQLQGGQARLLTISFDPQRDTPTVLARYARKLGADPSSWTFATVADARDLPRLLRLFEIVVLPDGRGDYVHNAALFRADGGRLTRAYDIERPDMALAGLGGK